MYYFTALKNRSILEMKGEDTLSFLQNILTNNMTLLNGPQTSLYSLLLTPQGKFLYDVFIIKRDNGIFWLDVLTEKKEEWVALLKQYKLRSKITFEEVKTGAIYALSSSHLASLAALIIAAHPDPRTSQMGWRMYGLDSEIKEYLTAQNFIHDSDYYQKARFSLLLPEASEDMVQQKSYPLEYGFEKLHAIDFKKGCYIGQEVTTRTWHRGVIRKEIYGIIAKEGSVLPKNGEIIKDGKSVGTVSSIYKNTGLALFRKEEVTWGDKGEIDGISVSFVRSFVSATPSYAT